jgi:hypothetical protein
MVNCVFQHIKRTKAKFKNYIKSNITYMFVGAFTQHRTWF